MTPDIYHVTPITPNDVLIDVCANRNLLISFYRPDQLRLVRQLGRKRMADNGRFSEWIAAMKAGREWSEANLENRPYYDWLAPFIDEPGWRAIMPDIPGAPSQLNDGQLLDWPFAREKGLPVYHMDGPIRRLGRLLDAYPSVCMGWIGHPKRQPVGCPDYWRRVDEIEAELGAGIWRRVHMLRGIAVAFDRDFEGADASSLGQNGHRYDSPMDEIWGNDIWRGRRAYADRLERPSRRLVEYPQPHRNEVVNARRGHAPDHDGGLFPIGTA